MIIASGVLLILAVDYTDQPAVEVEVEKAS